MHPGADELCDGIDQDCDGDADESAIDLVVWYFDADGDGYGLNSDHVEACDAPASYVDLPGDCDDELASVNPAATEVCNERDDDCDGDVDTDATDMPAWFVDGDGDGYGDDATLLYDCDEHVDRVSVGGDCDDEDEALNPAAVESCDGVDQDCDGEVDEDARDATSWWADADADGYPSTIVSVVACEMPAGYLPYGTSDSSQDCDDGDPAINPSATEVCDNGVDENCQPSPECGFVGARDLDDAYAFAWYSASGLDACVTGFRNALFADWDGDGAEDLIFAGSCAWFVVDGPFAAETSDYRQRVYDSASVSVNTIASVGDVTGDGAAEVAADMGGVTYIFAGGAGWAESLSHADARSTIYEDPTLLAAAGDQSGDGEADLAVATATQLDLYDVRSAGEISAPFLTIAGVAATRVLSPGDLTGDGLDDLLVSDQYAGDYGEVWLFQGPASATTTGDADVVLDGLPNAGTDPPDFGSNLTSGDDVDDDGTLDVLVAADVEDTNGKYAGAVYLFHDLYGRSVDLGAATIDAGEAELVVYGVESSPYSMLGANLALPGDMDRDGVSDVIVGGQSSSSCVVLLPSPSDGTIDLSSSSPEAYRCATWIYDVAAPGDLDGDGDSELAVAVSDNSFAYTGTAASVLYILNGGSE